MNPSTPNSVLLPTIEKNVYTPTTLPSNLYGSGKRGMDIELDNRREARAQENIVMTEADFNPPVLHSSIED